MEHEYEDIASMLASMAPRRTIAGVLQECQHIATKLQPFDPIKTASLVSGLLTLPSLHANTLRIEMLVHLILACSTGNNEPTVHRISTWLNNELGTSSFVNIEDPVEDVFVSNVIYEGKNYRIFEGVWESSDYYLQRILNTINSLPYNQDTNKLRREIKSILSISDSIVSRSKLCRFESGGGVDKGTINVPTTRDIEILRQAITFSIEDLNTLGISAIELEPYIFNYEERNHLKDESLDDSPLQRFPIISNEGKWIVLLPNNISFAVKIHILNWIISSSYQNSFDSNLTKEYHDFFIETPFFGIFLPQGFVISSYKVSNTTLMSFTTEIDNGRYVQLIAIVDSIFGYERQGFNSAEFDYLDELGDKLELQIKEAQFFSRNIKGFKHGLTLLVGCGYGRPRAYKPIKESPDWFIEFVTAPDFQTLSWTSEESKLFLWKLIQQKRYLSLNGISIANINGLLNLYGWWKDTNYLMIPPKVEFGDKPLTIAIPTDSLMEIRRHLRQAWDLHALPFLEGRAVRVRKKHITSYFPGEENTPLYVCIDAALNRKIAGVWIGESINWWVSVGEGPTILSKDVVFQVWDAVHNWLERAVPVLEQRFNSLPCSSIYIVLDFSSVQQEPGITKIINEPSIELSVTVENEAGVILIKIYDSFFTLVQKPRNVAERALLSAIVSGVVEIDNRQVSNGEELDKIVDEILPNEDARYFHMFEAVRFRDYMRCLDYPDAISIDAADEAMTKLGLGWRVHNRKQGNRFISKEESTEFLNRIVHFLMESICNRLKAFNRVQFIEQLLRYIEGVEIEKLRWLNTIRAVIALRVKKEHVKQDAAKQIMRYNASGIALRLIAETAVSECPLESGQSAGTLDILPLMSEMLTLFHLAGWSDAINKEVMNPEIKISPNGDVLSHRDFFDEIVDPFGFEIQTNSLEQESAKYEKKFEVDIPAQTPKGVLPDAFLIAVEKEFGLSIEAILKISESLENSAIEREKCVFIVPKTELVATLKNSGLIIEDIENFIKRFTLWPREKYRDIPQGYKLKDLYLWRFGRALSLIARPLVRLEDGNNPRFIISPGLLTLALTHTLNQYFEAEVDTSECSTAEMKSWIDTEKSRRSHEFVKRVADVMKAAGYEVRIEITVTELLSEKTNIDYGDVDVLAWKPGENKILCIECKDLKLAKTPGEIAESLNRFRGQRLNDGSRDELLKHLDRCAFLRERTLRIAKMLGISEGDIIIKAIVCFSVPTPINYIAKSHPEVNFVTIDELVERVV